MSKLVIAIFLAVYSLSVKATVIPDFIGGVSNVLGVAKEFVCGGGDAPTTPLSVEVEYANKLQCQNEEDLVKHCACVATYVGDLKLRDDEISNLEAEVGFMTHDTTSFKQAALSNLLTMSQILGEYGHPSNKCLDEEEMRKFKTDAQDQLIKSLDQKNGVPALIRDDFYKQAMNLNKVGLMSDEAKQADAKFVNEVSKYIASKDFNLTFSSNSESPFSAMLPSDGSNLNAMNMSFSLDQDRAKLVEEFLTDEKLAEFSTTYKDSPLLLGFIQQTGFSRMNFSDFIGRLASRSGMVDMNRGKMSPSGVALEGMLDTAKIFVDPSIFTELECNRIAENIKLGTSSNYPLQIEPPYNMDMGNKILSTMHGKNALSPLKGNLDPNDPVGKANLEKLAELREKYNSRLSESFEFMGLVKKDSEYTFRNFEFSRLICDRINQEKANREAVAEIEESLKEDTIIDFRNAQEVISKSRDSITQLDAEAVAMNTELLEKNAETIRLMERKKKLQEEYDALDKTYKHNRRMISVKKGSLTADMKALDENIQINNQRVQDIQTRMAEIEKAKVDLQDRIHLAVTKVEIPKSIARPEGKIPIKVIDEFEREKPIEIVKIKPNFASIIADYDLSEYTDYSDKSDPKIVPKLELKEPEERKQPVIAKVQTEPGKKPVVAVVSAEAEASQNVQTELERKDNLIETVTDELEKLPSKTEGGQEVAGNAIANGLEAVLPALQDSIESTDVAIDVAKDTIHSAEGQTLLDQQIAFSQSQNAEIGRTSRNALHHIGFSDNESIGKDLSGIMAAAGDITAHGKFHHPMNFSKLGGHVSSFVGGAIHGPTFQSQSNTEKPRPRISNSDGYKSDEESLDEFSEKVFSMAKEKLAAKGYDMSGGSSAAEDPSETVRDLEIQKEKLRAENKRRKTQIKNARIDNIVSSGETRAYQNSAVAEYAPTQNYQRQKDENLKSIAERVESKLDRSKPDKVVESDTQAKKKFSSEERLDVLKAPQDIESIAAEVSNGIEKAQVAKANFNKPAPRASKKVSSPSGSGGGGKRSPASLGGSSAGGAVSSAPSAVTSGDSLERTPQAIDIKGLDFQSKSFDVTPILEGVDDGLYVRMVSFEAPEDFNELSEEKKEAWIAQKFIKSKTEEAVLVLPSGKKVYLKKK